MKVLVDTCIWTRFLRRDQAKEDPLNRETRKLIEADAVQMLGVIRQELLSGAQPEERFEDLKHYLRFFPNLQMDAEDDENAARYYNVCRRKGVQGTAIDLIICAAAVRHNFRIFTTDTDFKLYSHHVPIKLHRGCVHH